MSFWDVVRWIVLVLIAFWVLRVTLVVTIAILRLLSKFVVRAVNRGTDPKAGQIWEQGNTWLYIKGANNDQIQITVFDPATKIHIGPSWTESIDVWNRMKRFEGRKLLDVAPEKKFYLDTGM